MTIKEEIEECSDIMQRLAEMYFDNKCAVTYDDFTRTGFAVHHKEEKDEDVLSRDYKKKYKKYRYRIHYLRDLEKQFESDPTLKKRTVLVKNSIHMKFDHPTNGICKMSIDNIKRFCEIALKTRTQGRKRKI